MRRIAVVGLPYFGTRVASTLIGAGYDARFVPAAREAARNPRGLVHLVRADLVYAIGSSIDRRAPLARLARWKQVLMHWVGSDVVQGLAAERGGRVSGRLRTAAHWADASWLIEEMAPLGLAVEEHPLPMPIAFGEPKPMPGEARVLVFLPRQPHAAYDVAGTIEVIDRLPEVPFVLVGGFSLNRPNVENLGFVSEMSPVYQRCSAFMRLVHHDGLSHSVVEALSFGRAVIWNYPLDGVTRIAGVDDAVGAIREHVSGPLVLNERGIEASHRYLPERVVAEACEGIEALLR